ncbi:hypothetical protein RchiOBHm_Chr0c17g0499951 [Rosa chinensis]|uniref:Uncharacterized protein n=1 Tax=Rosa chinensis TaxID=74649 RepID=A0A2P6SQN5_ROSCH|nr:hypothetical protein RchiOBHm_Chr0c17g0499951 [Rosa chinensis]
MVDLYKFEKLLWPGNFSFFSLSFPPCSLSLSSATLLQLSLSLFCNLLFHHL